MTESQVLESTKALNALETSHPGQIPQSILSSVQPNDENISSPLKRKHGVSQQGLIIYILN